MSDALQFLLSQNWQSFAAAFWILVFVEVPRFFVGAAVLTWFILFRRNATPEAYPHGGEWTAADGSDAPPIAAIVPGHNDAESIVKTVSSLREQTCGLPQIIVIDDGSSDDTDLMCRRLEREGLIDSYMQLRSRGGKAAAINAGLTRVRRPLVLVTDADTTFDRDALARAAAYFRDPRVAVVGGNLRVRNLKTSLATRVQQLNYGFSITVGRIVKDVLGFYFVASGAFGMYRIAAVRSIGGWDVGPGEDGDILTRLRLAGWEARFAYRATAMTAAPTSFITLARQRVRWDRSMIRNRLRKAGRHVLNPFRAGFKLPLAISFIEIYFFNGLVPYLFLFYLFYIIILYGPFAFTILTAVLFTYIGMSLAKFCVMIGVSTRPLEDLKLVAYVPLLGLTTAYFLRAVRLYANTNELVLRGSYRDPYVPRKVRERTEVF